MRHRKANVKLGRTASHRTMMLRNMVTALFANYLVDNDAEKAKEARRAAADAESKAGRGRDVAQPVRRTSRMVTTVDKAKALKPLVDKV
ncbi:MAG: 50S ribosomal protein L17, partial [Deltaproteobacteria bacterium]|nr:50S ribosomal protein L17 [Deltaproteobacteria bacterium]